MDNDKSNFNVDSLIARDKVTKAMHEHEPYFSEERGEPKRNRTEVLLLTSLTPLPLGQTGPLTMYAAFTGGSSCTPRPVKPGRVESVSRVGRAKRVARPTLGLKTYPT